MKHALWRHKILIVIWLVVFGIGGYTSYLLFFKSNGGENPYVLGQNDPDSANQPKISDKPKEAKVGAATQDGNIELTVNGVTCKGETTIGDNAYAKAEAEGNYCRVNITVKNLGPEAATLLLHAQKAFGDRDDPLLVAKDATQYAQEDQTKDFWADQIQPGKTATGDLVYDVNGSERLHRLELHGSENSPGITLSL